MPRLKIIVSGKVQGVYYRAFTAEQAQRFGVSGTVRNLPDGNVEILAEAEQANLDMFLARCRRGPLAARVENLEITDLADSEAFLEFVIIRR